ncbi:MAG TPA: tellurite resistance TerB family protein [Rhodopila sp.]|nr:tellurite resistance TerB family protein [Rhodopila sp.]
MRNKYTRAFMAIGWREGLEAMFGSRCEMLMDATIAGCAIVAHADGRLDQVEIRRMMIDMREHPMLASLPRETIAAEFENHRSTFAISPAEGRMNALRMVRPLSQYPRLGQWVLDVCTDVARADHHLHPTEIDAIFLLRRTLGLPPEASGAPVTPGPRWTPPLAAAEPGSSVPPVGVV